MINRTPDRQPQAGDKVVVKYWGTLWTGVLGTGQGSNYKDDLNALIFDPESYRGRRWPHRAPEVWINAISWNEMLECWVAEPCDD